MRTERSAEVRPGAPLFDLEKFITARIPFGDRCDATDNADWSLLCVRVCVCDPLLSCHYPLLYN